MLTQQRLYNHHILDIMTSMQSVNIMVERLAIQLKIVKHSNIKCNLCSTRGGLLFKKQKASVEKNHSTIHANASTNANVDQVAVIEQRHGGQSFNHVHP